MGRIRPAKCVVGSSGQDSADPGRQAISILIADDQAIFSEGLSRILQAEPDFQVVGSAGSGDEAVVLAREVRPDLVLLGLSPVHVAGLETLARIVSGTPGVRVIVLAATIDRAQTIEAVVRGARGVLLKACGIDHLYKSIRRVMAGEYWVARDTVSDLVRSLVEQRPNGAKRTAAGPFALTAREREILALVVAGCANKDIAEQCSLGEDTVKHHLTSIFSKTGVTNRLELALFAIHRRLVAAA